MKENELAEDSDSKGMKTSELARLHRRTAGAIWSRLVKIGLIEK